MKTMILRRVIIFSKLAILLVVIWLSENFTVRTPKCCLHDTHKNAKTMNKRPVTVFCKLAIFWATMGFGANFTVTAKKCRCEDQQQNTS